MVISHKNKYLFIENGQTGCSAIRNELIENYEGMSILGKHSVYSEFLSQASKEEKKYFVFFSIRNPLDKSVSTFLKYKYNHRKRYTDRINFKGRQAIYDIRDLWNYRIIKKDDFSYKDYLKKNKWYPYDDMSSMYHGKIKNVIRFESLNEDFLKNLRKIGIEPLRDLPVFNVTKKKTDFIEFYDDEEIREYAFEKFAVFMGSWNYSFPESWQQRRITFFQKSSWNFFHILRILSWNHLRKGLKDV